MLFYFRFFFILLKDVVIVPLSCLFNFFSFDNKSTYSQEVSRDNEEHLICVHHYVPRGVRFKKDIGGREFDLGVDVVFSLANINRFRVYCYLLGVSDAQLEEYKANYPRVFFFKQEINKFDFYSYFNFTKLPVYSEYSSVSFFNDNVDLKSDLESFVKQSSTLISNSIGIVGIGYNSNMTQSVFKTAFSPHIQTFGFTVSSSIFSLFAQKWYAALDSAYESTLFKAGVCRLLEQGISKYVLSKGLGMGIIKNKRVYVYKRRFRYFDLSNDWTLPRKDSRLFEKCPFRF